MVYWGKCAPPLSHLLGSLSSCCIHCGHLRGLLGATGWFMGRPSSTSKVFKAVASPSGDRATGRGQILLLCRVPTRGAPGSLGLSPHIQLLQEEHELSHSTAVWEFICISISCPRPFPLQYFRVLGLHHPSANSCLPVTYLRTHCLPLLEDDQQWPSALLATWMDCCQFWVPVHCYRRGIEGTA